MEEAVVDWTSRVLTASPPFVMVEVPEPPTSRRPVVVALPTTVKSPPIVEEAEVIMPTEVVGESASAEAVSWRVSFCREAPPVKEAVRPLRSEPKVAVPSTARVEEAPSEEETSRVPFTVEEALVTNPSGKFHAKPVVDAWK